MNSFIIPLLATAQTLTVNLGGTAYKLNVYWNAALGAWILDILDSTGTLISGGLAMVPGVDILGQLAYLGIPGAMVIQSSGGDPLASPTFSNLGTTSQLFYVPFSS
jgi:hypothetical protein